MKQNVKETKEISSQTFFVRAAGFRLRVKRIELTSKKRVNRNPTLVFLHEGLGCIEIWKDFPESLCKLTGCSGLVYDRKGYGGSEKDRGPWPMDYLQKESLTYLLALLKACGIDKAILIGHSDGGTIALIFAARNGHMVKGVVTEAAHIFVEEITLQGIRKAVKAFQTTTLKEKFARYHNKDTETVFYRWANRWLSAEFHHWNIEEYLPEITCPVLVLQGENDAYGTSRQVEGIVSRVSGPVEAKLIPDCGHTPHFQAKDRVLSEMTRFIKMLIGDS